MRIKDLYFFLVIMAAGFVLYFLIATLLPLILGVIAGYIFWRLVNLQFGLGIGVLVLVGIQFKSFWAGLVVGIIVYFLALIVYKAYKSIGQSGSGPGR